MAAAAVTALLALLAANGTSPLDCVCRHVQEADSYQAVSDGEKRLWWTYCVASYDGIRLRGSCASLRQSAIAGPATARLVPWDWRYGAPPAAGGLGSDCGAALAHIQRLTWDEVDRAICGIAHNWTESWAAQGLNDMTWTEEMLETDHLRHQKLSQLLQASRRILRDLLVIHICIMSRYPFAGNKWRIETYLEAVSKYYRGTGRLLPLLATHLSQLFIPLVFEHTGNHSTGLELSGWINAMDRVRDMLEIKLQGLTLDAQIVSEQMANYKVEEEEDRVIVRRPLLSDGLLVYQERLLFFHEDFGALCEQHQPNASQVFGLADALYSFLRENIFYNFSKHYGNVDNTGGMTGLMCSVLQSLLWYPL